MINTAPIFVTRGTVDFSSLTLTDGIDPCIQRVLGVWCINGHVAIINLKGLYYEGSLPAELNYLKKLQILLLDDMVLTGDFPSIPDMTSLTTLSIRNCRFKKLPTQLPATLKVLFAAQNNFAELPSNLNNLVYLSHVDLSSNDINNFPFTISKLLEYIDVGNNRITSQVPNFSNLPKLAYIDLSNNNFFNQDSLENHFQNLSSLEYFSIRRNNFNGEIPKFKSSLGVETIDISFNNFTGTIPDDWALLKKVTSIQAASNQIRGPFDFTENSALKKLDLSYNLISEQDYAVWGGLSDLSTLIEQTTPESIESISFEGNNIDLYWETHNYILVPVLKTLNLANNKIRSLPTLNLFAKANPLTFLDVKNNQLSRLFPTGEPNGATLQFLDLTGNPGLENTNNNKSLPIWAKPTFLYEKPSTESKYLCSQFQGKYSALKFRLDPVFTNFQYCTCESGYYGKAPLCSLIPQFTLLNNSESSGNFNDDVYGNQRFMPGLATSWVVGDFKQKKAKIIEFHISINAQTFTKFDDIMEIYEGDESLVGQRVFTMRGTDKSNFGYEFVKIVLDAFATLTFRSSSIAGHYFSANYSVGFACPDGYLEDPSTGKCYERYFLNKSLQAVVYVTACLSIVILISVAAVFYVKRNSMIVRSSSVPFLFSMLFFKILLSVSSIFYALDPGTGEFVCHLRPWLTGTCFIGILSSLLMKVNRIRKIFNSNELTVVVEKNSDLAKYIFGTLILEFALLIANSLSGVSPQTLSVGSGSNSSQLVYNCGSMTKGYAIWLGLQFAYIGLFLVGGSYVGWTIRKVPSAFNESPQIAASFFTLVILVLVLIPLNFIVDDNPNALVIIRGFGLNLASLVMTVFLYGQKLYYIMEGRENDKSLSSLGSSINKSSSSSSSSIHLEMRSGSSPANSTPLMSPS